MLIIHLVQVLDALVRWDGDGSENVVSRSQLKLVIDSPSTLDELMGESESTSDKEECVPFLMDVPVQKQESP